MGYNLNPRFQFLCSLKGKAVMLYFLIFDLFLFIFFFFFQPFIGLGQAIQSLLQVFFWREGGEGYTRYTSRKSYQFGCFFCGFLVFFFSKRLRISSFFSCPKQARRRRRGRKSKCSRRLIITYFYKRFFLYLLDFSILQGGFLVFTILIPFLLTNPTRRFLGRLG